MATDVEITWGFDSKATRVEVSFVVGLGDRWTVSNRRRKWFLRGFRGGMSMGND